jgi:hypothetical protein
VPPLDIKYDQSDGDATWQIVCGGSRAYVARVGSKLNSDIPEQAADSHFMIRRVTVSLLLAQVGLFQAEATSRIVMSGIEGDFKWTAHLDWPDPVPDFGSPETIRTIYDWFGALSRYPEIRRAAEDAHLALSHPHEALVYVYRGFEWLVVNAYSGWDEVAHAMGVSPSVLKDLKKFVNVATGLRHASIGGVKARADLPSYATWVAGLLDAINATRAKLESSFTSMSSSQVAEVIKRAVTATPYE